LIAIGSAGWFGFGVGEGPQNRYDFVPYRNADYIFSVVAEETGLLGVIGLMLLQAALVLVLLRIASRSRERFGRILVVGVATFLGSQTLMHIAVCSWLVPSTGLPLPLMSYGGSSTMVTVLALAMALNIGARRQPALASDAFR
jgi:rod shape determining protein RodA